VARVGCDDAARLGARRRDAARRRRGRILTRVVVALLAVAAAVALVAVGRVTANRGSTRDYLDGLRQGRAEGVEQGRAYQEALALRAGSRPVARTAFEAGYAAGANDVFDGYDGGWDLARPYVVTLERGHGPITYRIASRMLMSPGRAYRLCAHAHAVC